MMEGTDYVVRTWQRAAGTRERVTVVDAHGRLAHVHLTREQVLNGAADRIIRHRLSHLPEPRVYRQ